MARLVAKVCTRCEEANESGDLGNKRTGAFSALEKLY